MLSGDMEPDNGYDKNGNKINDNVRRYYGLQI